MLSNKVSAIEKTTLLIIFLSLLSIVGSFYTEFYILPPCSLCITIRYSMIGIFLIALLSLFSKKIKFILILPIAISLWADLKLIKQEIFSSERNVCEGNICQTPELLGIRLSIWAFLIILSIIAILLFDIIRKLKKQG